MTRSKHSNHSEDLLSTPSQHEPVATRGHGSAPSLNSSPGQRSARPKHHQLNRHDLGNAIDFVSINHCNQEKVAVTFLHHQGLPKKNSQTSLVDPQNSAHTMSPTWAFQRKVWQIWVAMSWCHEGLDIGHWGGMRFFCIGTTRHTCHLSAVDNKHYVFQVNWNGLGNLQDSWNMIFVRVKTMQFWVCKVRSSP